MRSKASLENDDALTDDRGFVRYVVRQWWIVAYQIRPHAECGWQDLEEHHETKKAAKEKAVYLREQSSCPICPMNIRAIRVARVSRIRTMRL